jgi:rifampicin phosphotransferase
MTLILRSIESIDQLVRIGGGKAANLGRLTQKGFPVPEWFVVTSNALELFLKENDLAGALKPTSDLAAFSKKIEALFLAGRMPAPVESALKDALANHRLEDRFVAVRSSGLDEDSADNSFAGQFSSYLFQKGYAQIGDSLKRCWASGFSERALAYRIERGIQLTDIKIGVVVQLMVNADAAGVSFSRNPIRPLDRDHLVVSSVWGLGEGLVSGELDADHYEVHRDTLVVEHQSLAEKTHAFRQALAGGLQKSELGPEHRASSSLTEPQLQEVAKLSLTLEKHLGGPQDSEWAFENGKLYFVQTRPVTNLPKESFFDPKCNGDFAILWDNSNIIESYNGVTSPLTFSFASSAYRQVYIQFCEVMGVPREIIQINEPMFRNMLGLIRGNFYYNLIHWYKLVLMLPGAGSNKGFMDTMMGVKQKLKPEHAKLFDDLNPQEYSRAKRLWVTVMTLGRFFRINSIVRGFQSHFNQVYESARKLPFASMSLTELAQLYQRLDDQILRRWHAPIINDYLCMIFFGLLKKLTEKWIGTEGDIASVQNDLLCGQGDLESTEPTKMLMRIADSVDNGESRVREWVLATPPSEIWAQLKGGKFPELHKKIDAFLDKYGFRCINELKLEEPDLHDDPSFVINAVASYVRMKAYSVKSME